MKEYIYGFRTWHSVLSIAALTCCILFATYSFAQGVQQQVAAGQYHTVGLKCDGTVVAVGLNNYGQLDVSTWTDIIQVAAGNGHTVGLKCDGTVVATGWNYYDQLNVSSWTDIIQVAANGVHTVGLKYDGTVVATGNNHGQLDVSTWTDIIQVAAGNFITVGLRSDGTVVATVSRYYGYSIEISTWTDIVQVTAGSHNDHTYGLKSDGTVVAYGYDVTDWTDITQVDAGGFHTCGLRSDGTVVATGLGNSYGQQNVSSWTDITHIDAGVFHTCGLRSDGTVVATGYNYYGQCNVSDWDLTCDSSPATIDIKPGSDPNCFNNDGHGVIPVAILSDCVDGCIPEGGLDATQIDPATVKLEALAVRTAGKSDKLQAHIEDVNNDGCNDLVVQIEDQDGMFEEGEAEATLTGNLYDVYGGMGIEGTDTICIVP